jgi:hypothetical protein
MIKEFKNLEEAYKYCDICPLCHNKIIIDGKDEKITIFPLDKFYKVEINNITNKIKFCLTNVTLGINFKNSNLIIGKTICCYSCNMYDYMIQLHFNFRKDLLSKIVLNSEFVSIENSKKDVYEISNKYTFNETNFTYFGNNIRFSDVIKFPLISENLFHPHETLERLKKLSIFQ